MLPKKLRPSPTESATLFPPGTVKKGNNGFDWVVTEYKDKDGKLIKKWKSFEVNYISTKKDIDLAISNLSKSSQKVITNLYEMKKELKKNKIDLFIIGQNVKSDEYNYFSDIYEEQIPEETTDKYLYACFHLIKDYTGNVIFNNSSNKHTYIYHNLDKKTSPFILQVLDKYLKGHFLWNGISENAITITFEKVDPEKIITDDNFNVEITIYFKKPNYYNDFEPYINKNHIISNALDYSDIELSYPTIKDIKSANKIMKHYFDLLYKNKKIDSFSIYCTDKNSKEEIAYFNKFLKPTSNKKFIEYMSNLK